MVKKLFTLVALFALCLGAKAEVVEDVFIDYSTATEIQFFGWGASESARERLSLEDGCLHFHSEEATDPTWDCQFHPVGIQGAAEEGTVYTMTLKIKGSEAATISAHFAGVTNYGAITFGTDWQEISVQYEATNTDNACLFQCGGFVGDYWIQWIKITHEEVAGGQPEVWNDILVNGNAEGEYGEVPCAYGKEYQGRDASNGNAEIAQPQPATIEADPTDPSNKVFVVHSKRVDPNEYPDFFLNEDGSVKGDPEWQNQFWIMAPKSFKDGEQVKISFRYKASEPAKSATQCHAGTPGDYRYWQAIGDVSFTTEWQTYEVKYTVNSDGRNDGQSIAFNLGANKNYEKDIDYYFDDLKWEELELEEGLFVAGAYPQEGLAYDFSKSVSMEWNDAEGYYEATVGTTADPVAEMMVSTKRGNDKAFQANTLNVTVAVTVDNYTDWLDYEAKAKKAIKLPGAGVWKVMLDEGYGQMSFELLEGKLFEKLDIKPNPIEIVVAGVERDDIKDDDHPDGTGAAWDNQFWIMANRTLSEGEETYVEFEYMGSVEAKTTTQCHKGAGEYLHWAAIGDVNFTTNWQKAEISFTIPSAGDGMQSIAFNMAEIKGACDYHIKNVIWKLADDSESLIDMTGDKNFWWKVGAGNSPVQGDPAGIQNVTVGTKVNGAMFNLAGQKVDKNYKGIVIKDGKKFVK